MITDNKHEKHTKLSRPATGEFNRNELAILGTTCGNIRAMANAWIQALADSYRIAFVDADHKATEPDNDSALVHGAALEFTDKISYRSLNYKQEFNKFQYQSLFNNQNLVLVNGNHFKAQSQIVVVDPVKPLDKKLDKLTHVTLMLLAEGVTEVPDYLQPYSQNVPVLSMNDTSAIVAFIRNYLIESLPPLYGLVLAGGKSQRMETDKGSIVYYGKSQRLHVHEMLSRHCQQVYVSYADEQTIHQDEQLPVVLDTFTGLGPYSGILSAFRTNTNAAWITLACDLPYLTPETLAYLVQHRNPSKIATAFMDAENKFPEPLITIWEPRAYPVLLQFLSQGYSCPRKVLINSDVELLTVPDVRELQNANYPGDRERALQYLQEVKTQ